MDQKTEPTPITPTPSPVRRLSWLFGLLTAVMLATIGFLFYQNLSLKKQLSLQKTDSPSQPTSVSPESVAEADDPTANWKIYTDGANFVEFKYPQSWDAKQLSGWGLNVFLDNHPFEIQTGTEFLTPIQVAFNEVQNTVTNQKYFEEKTLNEGVVRIKNLFEPNSLTINDLTVGGKSAKQLTGITSPGMLGGRYYVVTIIQLDNRLLGVSLHDQKFKAIYNQILSTFKFIESDGKFMETAQCPDGFTTFENEFFSFCQPEDMTSKTNSYSTTDDPPRKAVTVSFENAYEKIVINTSFTGGWGGGACYNLDTTVRGLEAVQMSWDSVGSSWDGVGGSSCTNQRVNMVTVIRGDGKRTGNLPIAIDYQRKGSNYLSGGKHKIIINSFQIKTK